MLRLSPTSRTSAPHSGITGMQALGINGEGIIAHQEGGMTILRLEHTKPVRRVLYLNSYGMGDAWRMTKEGLYPGQHLWGCLELVRMGYEIAMPDEPNRDSRLFNYRRQDLKYLRFAKAWLGRDGIVYSGHTILFWIPLLVRMKLLRCPVVSMLYACGESLRFAKGYRGLIALTPAAKKRALSLAPETKVAHLGWGVDLSFFPKLNYNPNWFLSCGKTRRDFETIGIASAAYPAPIRLITTKLPPGVEWTANVKLILCGQGDDWQMVPYRELIDEHYAGCSAALIVLEEDSAERWAAGFTQLLEAMVLAKPVIVTRTGALAGEIDVEKEGCGLWVPPNDAVALAKAMKVIVDDPVRAAEMGQKGRRLCETRYNIVRYADELHRFFGSL